MGKKWPECEAHHLPASSAKVNNVCEALAPLFTNLSGTVLRHGNKFHLRFLFDTFVVMVYI
jgi:hypothetical protein